jgi:hypothetical protein
LLPSSASLLTSISLIESLAVTKHIDQQYPTREMFTFTLT